jgi:hypothetical protein
MSFFDTSEPPEPEADPEPSEPKPWNAPPLRTVPGRLEDTLVLHHDDRIAVFVSEIAAYPTGFAFALHTVPRRYDPREWAGLDAFHTAPARTQAGELRPELLRYGVELADGRRATSLDFGRFMRADEDPAPPTLSFHGGRHGGGLVRQESWIWPLPPPGRLTFACEWPAAGVPLVTAEIDAQRIRDAAARSVLLWPDDGRDAPAGP